MQDRAVDALLAGHWYDAVAALLTDSANLTDDSPPQLAYARDLATAAKRVLDLDAEDFGVIAGGFRTTWADRLAQSCFPLEPRDTQRGALGSLVPLYELMLEVLELRAQRHEPLQIVTTAHLIGGEYLCQLAWESTLGGHGGGSAAAGGVRRGSAGEPIRRSAPPTPRRCGPPRNERCTPATGGIPSGTPPIWTSSTPGSGMRWRCAG